MSWSYVFAALICCWVLQPHAVHCACKPPNNNQNVLYHPSFSLYPVGGTVTYFCPNGYSLQGEEWATCLSSYQWSSYPPSCVSQSRRQSGCSRPANPTNGYVISYPVNMRTFFLGKSVTYRCKSNYRLRGNAHVICSANGWSSRPTCIRVCNRPNNPTNGYINSIPRSKQSFEVGEYISYHCNQGYVLSLEARIICQEDGWSQVPFCLQREREPTPTVPRPTEPPTRSSCPHRNAPRFGFYMQGSGKTIWQQRDVATFGCEPSYILTGSATSRCQSRGIWSSTVPTCERGCSSPPQVVYGSAHSTTTSNNIYVNGAIVIYRCDEGYHIQGNSRLRCENGRWSDAPTCRRFCQHRPLPKNALLTQQPDKRVWFPGEVARYGCQNNFFLFGDNSASCRDDGAWSNDLPTCERGCRRPSTPPHGIIRSVPAQKQVFSIGESVIYICDDWFHIAGDSTVTCREDGWSHLPICRHACQHREPPANGMYLQSEGKTMWFPGDVAAFACYTNYILYGSAISTCTDRYIWSSDLPSCQRGCLRPENPPFGSVRSDPVDKIRYGVKESIQYQCDRGYDLQGDPRVVCLNNGWSHIPTCLRACPHRAPPENGMFARNKTKTVWKAGDVAKFACLPDFFLVGYERSTCQRYFTWSSDVPMCKRGCVPLNNFSHGTLLPSKRSYSLNDVVTYRCDEGYKARGRQEMTCYYNGWSDTPRCDPFCADRPPPSHGRYENGGQDIWYAGDVAQFTCYHGYWMVGINRSVCNEDGAWDRGVPRCLDRRSCPNRNPPANGRYSSGSPRIYYPGDTVNYECESNYEIEGHSSSHCLKDGTWSRNVPTCQYVAPVPASCRNNCGEINAGGCACDTFCSSAKDCCNDYGRYCPKIHHYR